MIVFVPIIINRNSLFIPIIATKTIIILFVFSCIYSFIFMHMVLPIYFGDIDLFETILVNQRQLITNIPFGSLYLQI